MTRQAWTTLEQRDWLKSWIPRFLEAQENKTTSTFWPELYRSWEDKFPVQDPTANEVNAAGGTEKARKAKKQAMQKVIHLP